MAAPTRYTLMRHRANLLLTSPSFLKSLPVKRQVSDHSKTTNDEDVDNKRIPDTDSTDGPKLTGFAQAFARHAHVDVAEPSADLHDSFKCDDSLPFVEVFRNSSLVHLGAARNQIVFGKIFHVVHDDLYIDFGGKFHCVCKKPEENTEKYHRGAKVRLRLKDLELTDHFVGASRDLTILEADAELLGLATKK